MRKLNDRTALAIYGCQSTPASAVATDFGVSVNTVVSIWSGRRWSKVTGKVYNPKSRAVLSADDIEEIRRRLENGELKSDIAWSLGVANSTITRIAKGIANEAKESPATVDADH